MLKMEDTSSELVVKRCKLSLKGKRSISNIYSQTRNAKVNGETVTKPISPTDSPSADVKARAERKTNTGYVINNDREIATLPNLGNTCYMNSILHVLRIMPNFLPWLHTMATSNGKRELDILHKVFKSLTEVEKLNSLETQEDLASQLQLLVNLFAAQHPQYRVGQQFDAHEFLCWLVSALGKKPQRSKRDVSGAFVPSVLEGRAESVVVCTECETSTTRVDTFWDLKLLSSHVIYHQNVFAATDARASFNGDTMLRGEDKYLCGFCLRLTEARHSLRVLSLPTILVLHVPSKWQSSVNVPYRLSKELPCIKFDCCGGCRNASHLYNLFAAVMHVGVTAQFGHYVALFRRPAGSDRPTTEVRRRTRSNRSDWQDCCVNNRTPADESEWFLLDDERVDILGNSRPFVDPTEWLGSSARPAILWYQRQK